MAISNRDRVGQAFETFAEGAAGFVDRHMAAALGSADWIGVLAARSKGRRIELSKSDPQLLLRMLTEERQAFRDALSHVEQSYASEARDARNKWAHNAGFTADDTYRALDTLERLLTAMGAVEQAERVRQS